MYCCTIVHVPAFSTTKLTSFAYIKIITITSIIIQCWSTLSQTHTVPFCLPTGVDTPASQEL